MKRIYNSQNYSSDAKAAVVALGNFDGVHLAHQHLIGLAKAIAKKKNCQSVAYTFWPHPVKVLAPSECPMMIQTLEQRLAAIESLGVDACVVETFTADFAKLEPDRFFKEIIVQRLKALGIIVGYDFTFGLHRQGRASLMKELGEKCGVETQIIEARFLDDTLISSTNIRGLVERGDVRHASELLGRPYTLEGTVVKGHGIGVRLGAHTANLKTENELIPKDGVYLTRAHVNTGGGQSATYPSITSVGNNPTFPHNEFAIETHLLDANENITGAKIKIEFLDRIRDIITFKDENELKKQIKKDIEEAKKRHSF